LEYACFLIVNCREIGDIVGNSELISAYSSSLYAVRQLKLEHEANFLPEEKYINSLTFRGDGSLLAAGSHCGKVFVWNVWTKKLMIEFDSEHSINSVSQVTLILCIDLFHVAPKFLKIRNC
jgi:WD40 repeat protein